MNQILIQRLEALADVVETALAEIIEESLKEDDFAHIQDWGGYAVPLIMMDYTER